jgi:hypothetical protein
MILSFLLLIVPDQCCVYGFAFNTTHFKNNKYIHTLCVLCRQLVFLSFYYNVRPVRSVQRDSRAYVDVKNSVPQQLTCLLIYKL